MIDPTLFYNDYIYFESRVITSLFAYPIIRIGESNPSRWKNIIDLYKSVNMLKKNIDVDDLLWDYKGAEKSIWMKWVIIGLSIFVIIIIIFFFWNIYLKHQIEIRVKEIRKKDEQLLQAQKMETIGNLAGGLAHDFNNVLGGVIGPLSIMKRFANNENGNNEKLIKYISIAEASSQKAVIMVKRLLSLSRKHELELKPIDINVSLKNIIEICKNTFEKSIQLKPIYFDKRAIVNADATQIEQAVLNIAINASHSMTIMRNKKEKLGGLLEFKIDYIAPEMSLPENIVTKHIHNGYFSLSIKDEGVGIDKQTLMQIFDPFFTTKDKKKGTGLGLAMVYNILEQHQGFIDVKSKKNKGSIFTIYLPVLEEVKDVIVDVAKNESIIQSGFGTILIIDDEKIIREMAENMLIECGYKAVLAEDGEKGIEIYKNLNKKIDAILLDIAMPRLSGQEVFVKLKRINPDIKVLLTSGYKDDRRVKESMKLGISAFIQKPFTIEQLSVKIKEVIKS